jgi:hypothetical protein
MSTPTPPPLRPGVAPPPQEQGERREPEVRLGLSAAGREVEEVDAAPVGVRGIDHASEVQQNERELKRPPGRGLRPGDARVGVGSSRCRMAAAIALFIAVKHSKTTGSARASMPSSTRRAAAWASSHERRGRRSARSVRALGRSLCVQERPPRRHQRA